MVSLTAEAGSAVQVADSATGVFARVERTFAAGDAVAIDMEKLAVTVNDADATTDVTLGSDFFALQPGNMTLDFSGCSSHSVSWVERWA